MQRRALTSSSESRGYNTGGGSHFGSGLTINTAAGLYQGMIVLTHKERY
jgi:hypothetical protein